MLKKRYQVLVLGYGKMGHVMESLLQERHQLNVLGQVSAAWSHSGTSGRGCAGCRYCAVLHAGYAAPRNCAIDRPAAETRLPVSEHRQGTG